MHADTMRGNLPALVLLGLTVASGVAMQFVFSPVQEMAKAELGLTDAQLSLVQGLAAAIPIAILSIPIGWLVDRSSRVRLLIAMSLIWTAGTFLTVIAESFTTLFFARMLAGLGAAGVLPVAISIAADLSPPEQRGRSLLILSFGKIVGNGLAFALAGVALGLFAAGGAYAAAMIPWRGVHLAFGIAAALLIVPLFFLREPARKELGQSGTLGFGPALSALWRQRAMLAPLFLGQVTVVMADMAAMIWASPVLSRDYGLEPAEFAGWLGLVMLVSGVIGSILGGFAADWGQRRGPGFILFGAVIAAGVSIPAALFPIMPSVPGFAIMLALLLLAGAVTGLITATAIAVMVPNETRGLALGLFVVIGGTIGMGVAPWLVAKLSEGLGGEAHLGMALTIIGVAVSAIAFAGFALAMRSARRTAP